MKEPSLPATTELLNRTLYQAKDFKLSPQDEYHAQGGNYLEAEAEERRKQIIDEEEKKIRKLKRAAALAEARKAEF